MRFRRHLTEVWLASPTEGSIFACATSMMSSNGWGCPIFEDEIPQPEVQQVMCAWQDTHTHTHSRARAHARTHTHAHTHTHTHTHTQRVSVRI